MTMACGQCDDTYQKKHRVACDILKSLVTRFLFFLHVFIAVWRLADIRGDNLYWCVLALILPLVLDTFYTIGHRKGHEYKWASTSFLCFLIAAIPPIWMLELDRWNRYQQSKKLALANVTQIEQTVSLSSFVGIQIPLYFQPDTWVQVLEQALILLLVPTRWILPRGSITRERLSQVLLVYVALGADIIELFDLFEFKAVMEDFTIFLAILAAWSCSLLQFTVLLASSESRKSRFAFLSPYSGRKSKRSAKKDGHTESTFDPVEVASLCMTLILQDIPFLCIRLYIMIRYRLLSNTLIFFTFKNIYVILLQMYRIIVVACCPAEVTYKDKRKHSQITDEEDVPVQFDDIVETVLVDSNPSAPKISADNPQDSDVINKSMPTVLVSDSNSSPPAILGDYNESIEKKVD